jgi:hypothetical protein
MPGMPSPAAFTAITRMYVDPVKPVSTVAVMEVVVTAVHGPTAKEEVSTR